MTNRFEPTIKKLRQTQDGPFSTRGDLSFDLTLTHLELSDILDALYLASHTTNILTKAEEAVDE